MIIENSIFEFTTKEKFDFIDITAKAQEFIKKSQIKNGLLNIQTFHTTTAVIVNENEPLLLEDFKNNLEKIAPQNSKEYNHDDFTRRKINLCANECKNGDAHCKAIHLPVSVTLNIVNSEIQLGQWQRILFVELDRSRERKIQLQVIGE